MKYMEKYPFSKKYTYPVVSMIELSHQSKLSQSRKS